MMENDDKITDIICGIIETTQVTKCFDDPKVMCTILEAMLGQTIFSHQIFLKDNKFELDMVKSKIKEKWLHLVGEEF